MPQEQLRAVVLPADPVPIMNARTQDFLGASGDFRAASYPTVIDPVTGIPMPSMTLRVTQDNNNRVAEPYGAPVHGRSAGLDMNAIMPSLNTATAPQYGSFTRVIPLTDSSGNVVRDSSGNALTQTQTYTAPLEQVYGTPLNVLSVIADGTTFVYVTCGSVHGLQTGAQVSVQGLANKDACGFYSITVTTATAFNYQCYGEITPAGALGTGSTLILTALVGLPLGFTTIPQVRGSKLVGQGYDPDLVEVETGDGVFNLETDTGYIELEDGP